MRPAARVEAAIELLDEIVAAARDGGAAADTLIARYFKMRRYAGSKDRRAVRELVYRAIRRAGERPSSGRAAIVGIAREDAELAALFDGSPHAPAPIDKGESATEAGIAPTWLLPRLSPLVPKADRAALLERAPLDLRVNHAISSRDDMLAAIPEAVAGKLAPDALRLPEGFPVETMSVYEAGAVEIQDEGSQLVALACRAKPGMTIIDLCAGAGGKTLALAAEMAGEGILLACDTDRGRLSRLEPRTLRAGITMIESRLLDPMREQEALVDYVDRADVVLVDAPCSGTGTWRRNPEARWRLNHDRLNRLAAVQGRLLDLGATLVRPGGALVYAVCSLLDEEGSTRVAAFLARNPGWIADATPISAGRTHGPGMMLTPAHDGTDGFFVARLTRPC